MQTSLYEVILRTSAIYAVLFIAIRMLGKREVSQFTPFDLILLLTLANSVQNAMVGDNTSLMAGIAAALTLLLLNFLLSQTLLRHNRIRHWIEGTPTMLLRHGRVEWRALKRENMDIEDLKSAVRSHGFHELHEVDLAVLELDGSISVIGLHENNPSQRAKARRRIRSRGAVRTR